MTQLRYTPSMARYEDIATDLRRRIGAGEFGEVGDRIPTLSDLMAEYAVAGVQTMRAAQAVLVAEGVLETRHGSGAYISRVPSGHLADIDAVAHDLEQLAHSLTALRQRIHTLSEQQRTSEPTTSMVAQASQPGRAWEWASWAQCATCGSGGGITRGWVEDEAHSYDPLEYCREQDHDCSSGIGLLPDRDHADAVAVESWWEHHEQNSEASRLLLAGDLATAAWHAQRAQALAGEFNDFQAFSCSVAPPPSKTPREAPAPNKKPAPQKRKPRASRTHPKKWHVVEGAHSRPDDPVVIMGSYQTQEAANRALSRLRKHGAASDPDAFLSVRHSDKITSWMEYDVTAGRTRIHREPPT